MCRSIFSRSRHLLQVSGQLHAPAALRRGKSCRCIGGWVDPRAGLDDMEKLNAFTMEVNYCGLPYGAWLVCFPVNATLESWFCLSLAWTPQVTPLKQQVGLAWRMAMMSCENIDSYEASCKYLSSQRMESSDGLICELEKIWKEEVLA
jgi:hypothetical protein